MLHRRRVGRALEGPALLAEPSQGGGGAVRHRSPFCSSTVMHA